jgi:hypothetical protein
MVNYLALLALALICSFTHHREGRAKGWKPFG